MLRITQNDTLKRSSTSLLLYTVNEQFMSEQNTVQAYCVKCRKKQDMKDPQVVTLKNGKPASKGVCPECNTKMFRIGKI